MQMKPRFEGRFDWSDGNSSDGLAFSRPTSSKGSTTHKSLIETTYPVEFDFEFGLGWVGHVNHKLTEKYSTSEIELRLMQLRLLNWLLSGPIKLSFFLPRTSSVGETAVSTGRYYT